MSDALCQNAVLCDRAGEHPLSDHHGDPPFSLTPRKPRCRMLDRLSARCASEPVSEYGLCLRHLRDARDEYEAICAEAGLRGGDGR